LCSIANNVVIGGGAHPMDWVSTSPVFYEGRDSVKTKFSTHKRELIRETVIGHDVWIGQYAIIKQGIEIGTGSVIGMGSVVTKDIPPYSIVAGVPTNLIRKRFSEAIIRALLDSKWWDWNDSKMIKHGPYFNDIIKFIKFIK